MRGHKIFVAKIGGSLSFIDTDYGKFGTPLPKKMIAPMSSFPTHTHLLVNTV